MLPEISLKVPAEHNLQLKDALVSEYDPLPQFKQVDSFCAPKTLEYLPTGHELVNVYVILPVGQK